MSSFTIADCPPSLAATPIDKEHAGGKLSLTVRNTSNRVQTARISVKSDDADPKWFAIEGAPATRPHLLESDFEANATQTITVSVKAPRAAEEKTYTFQVNVTAEENPDNDHTDGPAVSLAVPALEQETPVDPRCRWCKPAIAAGVLLVLGIAAWFLLGGAPELPDGLEGETPETAMQRLIEAGFAQEDIFVEENGPALGNPPGTVGAVSTSGGGRRVTLVIDPGVSINAPEGSPVEQTVASLIRDGLTPEVARIGARDVAFFRVETVTPGHGEIVAKGSQIRITTFVPQSDPRPPLCERIWCSDVITQLEQVPMQFERPVLQQRNRILQGVEGLRLNENVVINPNGQN